MAVVTAKDRAVECRTCGATHRPDVPCPPTDRWLISRKPVDLMPIRPENVARYPAEWPAISWSIRWLRALGRCECRGECGRPAYHLDPLGRCENIHGQPAIGTGSNVVLTVAHLDHTPEHCHPANLRAMCQGCHLHYDRGHHAETRAATRTRSRAAAGELPLPFGGGHVTRPATCHPDRRMRARGLCHACYCRHYTAGTLDRFPLERPQRSRADLVADVEVLRAEGYTLAQMADRLGMKYRTFHAAYLRAVPRRRPDPRPEDPMTAEDPTPQPVGPVERVQAAVTAAWPDLAADPVYVHQLAEVAVRAVYTAEPEPPARLDRTLNVLAEVAQERRAQDAKWGVQDHPDGTGAAHGYYLADVSLARDRCDREFRAGRGAWSHILAEEYAEAMACEGVGSLRGELIQVAAVACAWVEAIDRRERS